VSRSSKSNLSESSRVVQGYNTGPNSPVSSKYETSMVLTSNTCRNARYRV
jgi:hypothetical protein